MDHYPLGTENLWMAYYRNNKDIGDIEGFSVKLSGKIEEVTKQAQKIAEKENAL